MPLATTVKIRSCRSDVGAETCATAGAVISVIASTRLRKAKECMEFSPLSLAPIAGGVRGGRDGTSVSACIVRPYGTGSPFAQEMLTVS